MHGVKASPKKAQSHPVGKVNSSPLLGRSLSFLRREVWRTPCLPVPSFKADLETLQEQIPWGSPGSARICLIGCHLLNEPS